MRFELTLTTAAALFKPQLKNKVFPNHNQFTKLLSVAIYRNEIGR